MSLRFKSVYILLLSQFILLIFLYSLCRIGFYWTNLPSFQHLSLVELGRIFWGGWRFDLVAIIYLNSLYLLLQIIPHPWRHLRGYQKAISWTFYIPNLIGFLSIFIDFAYYPFTLKHTTASVFKQFANEENLGKLSLDFLIDYWYLSILFIFFAVLLYVITFKPLKQFKSITSYKHYIYQSIAFIFIIGLCVVGVRGGWRHSTRPLTMSNAGDYVNKPEDMALVVNTPFTILKTLKRSGYKPVQYFSEAELNQKYLPIQQKAPQGTFKNLNVVFLIIESLGKEHVGALNKNIQGGNYKGYTPFLDSLVQESFTSSYTFANGRKSIDALPSIISGIPSIQEPFVLSVYSSNKTTSIAQLLKEKGYETAFFHGAPNGSMGFSAYTNLAGINKYYGKDEYANDADFDGMWGIWDEPFMQFMAKEISTLKQPFFTTFFSVSSHHPFKVPEKYKGVFPKGNLPVQEPIGYTDMALRNFFAEAQKKPWFKQTLFVICADHATVSYLPEYQNVMGSFAIPILFYYPAGNLKGTTNKLIQQIDIMPTVLNYLNYDKPYFSFGFDALSPTQDNFVLNNIDGSFNFYYQDYLLQSDGEKSIALYKFKTDTYLKNNILQEDKNVQQHLEAQFKAFLQQYYNRMINNQLTFSTAK
ncbi:MAG: alkaline phosphatase family protein [Pedobacter sp.]|nr:MAG: alkaline phosphatase family protein [Pedobacter sp.]